MGQTGANINKWLQDTNRNVSGIDEHPTEEALVSSHYLTVFIVTRSRPRVLKIYGLVFGYRLARFTYYLSAGT